MNIPFSPPDISEQEIEEVAQALRSGWITTGPRTKELERQVAAFCGTERAVCLNSQTACAEMALRVLGVGPGDEVITSAYTYTASASVICHVGAKLVLVDTQPDSLEMDYGKLEAAITEKTWRASPAIMSGSSPSWSIKSTCLSRRLKFRKRWAGWRSWRIRPMPLAPATTESPWAAWRISPRSRSMR